MRSRRLSLAAYSFLLIGTACSMDQQSESLEQWEGSVVVSSAACEVEYLVSSEWAGGFGANVRVKNKGSAVGRWTMNWTFADGQKVTSLWNGNVSQSGGKVTVTDSGWNGALGTGSSVTVGFNGTWTGKNSIPTGFALNGVSCEGGGTSNPGSGGSTGSGGSSSGGSTSGGTCDAPAFSASANYGAGDRVSSGGKVYQCKPYPYSGWCALTGYEPGSGNYWSDAWNVVGDCGGTSSGGSSSGGSTSSGGSSSGGSNGGTCNAPAWQQGKQYNVGDIVSYGGSLYIAENANPGYDPVISTWFWDPYSGGCSGGSGGTTSSGGSSGTGGGGNNNAPFSEIVSQATFNQLFPNRNPFYTYDGLLKAIEVYPAFAGTGDLAHRKREAAAFLANVTHETGDLVYVEEIAKGEYCDSSPWFCPCVSGKRYFGRGPIQISWNYNYCAASASIFGDREVLRQNPERVSQEPWLAWATALWFWMTQTGAGTMTAHDAIINDRGFGETIRTINGGLECGGGNSSAVNARIQYFQEISGLLGVSTGNNLGC